MYSPWTVQEQIQGKTKYMQDIQLISGIRITDMSSSQIKRKYESKKE